MTSFTFRPGDYGPTVAALVSATRLNDLGPGTPNVAALGDLKLLDPATAVGPVRDLTSARACISGLWLLHDFLDESHTISQDIETPDGSFWHAVMHRREPDPSNSKYWWRRVGPHPVLNLLREQSSALGYKFTDPYAFVDFVEHTRGTDSPDEELARRVQRLEWELLFDHCHRQAGGTQAISRFVGA